MWRKKNTIFLFIYTLLFSALIFVGRSIFFAWPSYEEQYIEPRIEYQTSLQEPEYESFSWVTQDEVTSVVHDLIYEEFSQRYVAKKKDKVDFRYIPQSLFDSVQDSYTPLAEAFLYSYDILEAIENLWVFFHKDKLETRWRMKSKGIHLYGIKKMSLSEFLGVLIHEFGHYIDIYYLPKSAFWDESQKFYDISWESVNHMYGTMKWEDFVSGYAMTNQYEDFAESYIYYILHNKQFIEKAKQSEALRQKYAFFQTYIFPKNIFYKESFSVESEVKDYYWDITKLRVDVKKFLQYLQSDI